MGNDGLQPPEGASPPRVYVFSHTSWGKKQIDIAFVVAFSLRQYFISHLEILKRIMYIYLIPSVKVLCSPECTIRVLSFFLLAFLGSMPLLSPVLFVGFL